MKHHSPRPVSLVKPLRRRSIPEAPEVRPEPSAYELRAGASGLSIESNHSELDSLRALHAILEGRLFWRPSTFVGVSKESVSALLDEVIVAADSDGGPALLGRMRDLVGVPAWERARLARNEWVNYRDGAMVGRGPDGAWRACYFAAGLPSEVVHNQSGGSLAATDSTLAWLPDDLEIPVDANLAGSSICELPKSFKVGRFLDLDNTAIKRIPADISIMGGLWVGECAIEAWPDKLVLEGSFTYSGGKSTSLPKALFVGGQVDLSSSEVVELPARIRVRGNLDLRGTKIQMLPSDLVLGGKLKIGGSPLERLTHEEIRTMAPGVKGAIVL